MRQQSNPEGASSKRPRPISCYDQSDSNLDDMLTRIKTLKEERKQILKDMSSMKNAFGIDEKAEKNDASDPKDATEVTVEEGNCTDNTEVSTPSSFDGISSNSIETNSGQSKRHKKSSRLASIDSGVGTNRSTVATSGDENSSDITKTHGNSNTKPVRRKRSDQHSSAGASSTSTCDNQIYCFICGIELGRFSKKAAMHMGLNDGDPICPDAVYLTESSLDKIKSIALLKNFDSRAKYEMLDTLELEMYEEEGYDLTSEDVLNKVENFLEDIENQKERDREDFDAIRSGAIDEIFAAEYGDFYENSAQVSSAEPSASISQAGDDSSYTHAFDDNECITEVNDCSSDYEIPTPPLQPEPPQTAFSTDTTLETLPNKLENLDSELKKVRSDLMVSIQSGKKLKRTFHRSDSSDPVGAGKVLHRHIAPRVFTNDVRDLMHDITSYGGVNPDDGKEDKKHRKKRRLKKVSTRDKSAPYIPKDMEIYFYAGPNKKENTRKEEKIKTLPPVSRALPNSPEISDELREIQPKAPSFGEGVMSHMLEKKKSSHKSTRR